MIELIENVSTWQKWTGGSLIVVLLFLSFLYLSGEKEAVELPSTINEAKQNVTKEVIEESKGIVGAFHEAGVNMAEDVDDPVVKKQIIGLMTFSGFMLFLIIVLSVLKAMGVRIWIKENLI